MFSPKVFKYETKVILALKDRQDGRKKQNSVGGRCGSMSSKGDCANVIDML